MPYEVQLTSKADKYLTKLGRAQPKDADAIDDALERLARQPRPPSCKQLKGYPDVRRIRVGDYRICYTIEDGRLVVIVIFISTRDNVYEILKRLDIVHPQA